MEAFALVLLWCWSTGRAVYEPGTSRTPDSARKRCWSGRVRPFDWIRCSLDPVLQQRIRRVSERHRNSWIVLSLGARDRDRQAASFWMAANSSGLAVRLCCRGLHIALTAILGRSSVRAWRVVDEHSHLTVFGGGTVCAAALRRRNPSIRTHSTVLVVRSGVELAIFRWWKRWSRRSWCWWRRRRMWWPLATATVCTVQQYWANTFGKRHRAVAVAIGAVVWGAGRTGDGVP